jgi:hypothetical protein
VALVKTDVLEEHFASVSRVKGISELLLLRSMLRLLATADVVPISLILFTLMMEAVRSSETSVLNKIHTK